MRLTLCDPHAKPQRVTVYEYQDGRRKVVAVYVVQDEADWTAEHIEQARLLDPPPFEPERA